MNAAAGDTAAGSDGAPAFKIDEDYEFSAPMFFDFTVGESDDAIKRAEMWFEIAISHAPSPLMPRIKMRRTEGIQTLCIDFSPSKEAREESVVQDPRPPSASANLDPNSSEEERKESADQAPGLDSTSANLDPVVSKETPEENNAAKGENLGDKKCSTGKVSAVDYCKSTTRETCTPRAQMISSGGGPRQSGLKDGTGMKTKMVSSAGGPRQSGLKDGTGMKKTMVNAGTKSSIISAKKSTAFTDFALANQAIKKQRLEGGRSRPILDIKNRVLLHKSKPGVVSGADLSENIGKGGKEERSGIASRRKVYVNEPFVSMAEMVKKFQSKTREMSFSSSKDAFSMNQGKPRLTLTRPQEPQLETACRSRHVKAKSSAELEEEMIASLPKFKALPLNRRILEAHPVPVVTRRTPQITDFQEFHLRTMERAQHQPSSISNSSSSTTSCQKNNHGKAPKLAEPKPPLLETAMRYRPPKVKSSQEMEQEELEKMPKFKARPLNKKIFESRGDMGVFCNLKRQLTVPREFHFATGERAPAVSSNEVAHLFDKLSLNSDPRSEKPLPRLTTPNPFQLHTEERGHEKERRLAEELMRKQWEEERARIPKAKPYPYTTDYPVMPPKPEPKACTKPEAFQLESLVRHEEEMQKKMLEMEKMEREEAEKRQFKAQPIATEDPVPVPEKTRIPLTQVQEFQLQVDRRAVDREEFDKKIKEKEVLYKRLREENEAARMEEEEKVVKHMRRTMVPHALPLPSFDNPFIPQKSSKETTKAKSPNLQVDKRNEKRLAACPSTAATHMR